MNLLLDTHVVLWWLDEHPALVPAARAQIALPANLVLVSAVSPWEMSIKQALGRLQVPEDLEAQLARARFQPLPITIAHGLAAGRLPRHHDDPFDRMLIAQAQTEGLTVVTHDTRFRPYQVEVLWT